MDDHVHESGVAGIHYFIDNSTSIRTPGRIGRGFRVVGPVVSVLRVPLRKIHLVEHGLELLTVVADQYAKYGYPELDFEPSRICRAR